MIRTLSLFAIGMVLGTTLLIATTDDGRGLCTTDSECALLCPADDLGCDGGPQGEQR